MNEVYNKQRNTDDASQEKKMVFKNVNFDGESNWACICEVCKQMYDIPNRRVARIPQFLPRCDIKGCSNEALFYFDMIK